MNEFHTRFRIGDIVRIKYPDSEQKSRKLKIVEIENDKVYFIDTKDMSPRVKRELGLNTEILIYDKQYLIKQKLKRCLKVETK